MFYLLLIIFLSLLVYVFVGEMPNSAFKVNKKYKLHILDTITSFIGGISFSLLPNLFRSGSHDWGQFDIGRDYLNKYDWSRSGSLLDEFVFGFIMTYIIILIRRSYKK